MMRTGLAIAALALMSCGETDDTGLGAQVTGLLFDQAEALVSPAPTVTREQLLVSSGQFIRVNIRDLERVSTMARAGANGARTTWAA